eukprot:31263-Pelagococcus_subviridis.AAC.2
MRREKSLRNGLHHANAVVWGPVYRTRLNVLQRDDREHALLPHVVVRRQPLRGPRLRVALVPQVHLRLGVVRQLRIRVERVVVDREPVLGEVLEAPSLRRDVLRVRAEHLPRLHRGHRDRLAVRRRRRHVQQAVVLALRALDVELALLAVVVAVVVALLPLRAGDRARGSSALGVFASAVAARGRRVGIAERRARRRLRRRGIDVRRRSRRHRVRGHALVRLVRGREPRPRPPRRMLSARWMRSSSRDRGPRDGGGDSRRCAHPPRHRGDEAKHRGDRRSPRARTVRVVRVGAESTEGARRRVTRASTRGRNPRNVRGEKTLRRVVR